MIKALPALSRSFGAAVFLGSLALAFTTWNSPQPKAPSAVRKLVLTPVPLSLAVAPVVQVVQALPTPVEAAEKPIVKKRVAKKNPLAQKRRARERFVEAELLAVLETSDPSQAINNWEPELHWVQASLDEQLEATVPYVPQKTAPLQLDIELALGLPLEEKAVRETVSLFQQNNFSEIRSRLAEIKSEQLTPIKSPFAEKNPIPLKAAAPVKKSELKKASIAKQPSLAKKSPVVFSPPVERKQTPIPPLPAPVVAETPSASSSFPQIDLAPVESSVATSLWSAVSRHSLRTAAQSIPRPRPRLDSHAVSTQNDPSKDGRKAASPIESRSEGLSDDAPFETDLFGRVRFSRSFSTLLENLQAHVELYLQPLGTRRTEDTKYLTHRFPQEEFREPATNDKGDVLLRGRYRLVAGVFRRQDLAEPMAQIFYPREINAQTAREQIRFFLDTQSLVYTSHQDPTERRHVNLTLTFFEGASGDPEKAQGIPGVEVKILGPDSGLEIPPSDEQGIVHIPSVANGSQLKIRASAPGYYPTFLTAPVFNGDAHQSAYLISKRKVALLMDAVGVSQKDAQSIVMGRVFDPETKIPLKGQKVELVRHAETRGRYFSLFADPQDPRTSELGFFSFFNVSSAFRYLARPDLPQFRFPVKPGSGYYIELGRGGKKPLLGRLLGPRGVPVAGASIRLAGENFEIFSDKDGNFSIDDIDFPPGVITLEVWSEEYGLTWHSVAWNGQYPALRRDIFLLPEHTIAEGLLNAHRAKVGPNPTEIHADHLGNLIGGAYGSLFDRKKGCLRPELWNLDSEKAVAAGQGPFPLRESRSGSVCLHPQKPGFVFSSLAPGEYLLKWTDSAGQNLGSRVIHIGKGRNTLSVN